MGTITVSISDSAEKKLRNVAEALYGRRKGYLGHAITDAIEEWVSKKDKAETIFKALQLIEEGRNMGKMTFKKREDLYER
ncbi:MAG: hypothetical protein HYX24_02300 [Candidatus Aenigmarchaeota archaeon]|nr:hypothetical protein [Candidatus Aenigmarchaeota archaeon]